MKRFFLFLICLFPITALAQTSLARHFEGSIIQSTKNGAMANGNSFDWEPGALIPAGNQISKGIAIPYVNTKMAPTGRIFIRGLSQVADNAEWAGMLEPDGVFRYTAVNGAVRTIPAFKLSEAPDPVTDYWASHKPLR